jgi:hypothetical protein
MAQARIPWHIYAYVDKYIMYWGTHIIRSKIYYVLRHIHAYAGIHNMDWDRYMHAKAHKCIPRRGFWSLSLARLLHIRDTDGAFPSNLTTLILCVCIYVCLCAWVHTCMYMCACLCVCVYICILDTSDKVGAAPADLPSHYTHVSTYIFICPPEVKEVRV